MPRARHPLRRRPLAAARLRRRTVHPRLIDGADYLFTNEYESHLTQTKTGWTQDEIDQRVTTRVITRGKDGADIRTRGEEPVHVPIAGDVERVDPTGVGDAFRAGFLVGLAGGLGHERCAQIGSVLAAHVLETVGTQEYVVTRTGLPPPGRRRLR